MMNPVSIMNPLKTARFFLWLLVSMFLLIFLLLGVNQSSFAAARASKVLVLGDSLSAGYGIAVEQGWVHLMRQALEAKYGQPKNRVTVMNASVSGETSSGGRTRLPALLRELKPEILILELGGNDGLRGQPLRLLDENLQAMIDAARQAGVQVLLVGMQITGNYGARYTREFKALYPAISARNHIPQVPFLLEGVASRPEWMQADQIHPNALGQASIKNTVLPFLLPMLKEK